MWVRATPIWKRTDRSWKIVHDHESVPWDPVTGQGLTTLEP
ncbi:nuclear transport factor 2 family protein [Microbacterium hatanonis]|uniref:Nuclear transport factor 2 family protein n=1 Tax=Microbacterium hatanonis TaxID=404366 RepID=A0A5C8I5D1_9MICO|nr:nuclear transport factor 2 family protein [Microbacterium hatanonis]